jgi:hypothetical protein
MRYYTGNKHVNAKNLKKKVRRNTAQLQLSTRKYVSEAAAGTVTELLQLRHYKTIFVPSPIVRHYFSDWYLL